VVVGDGREVGKFKVIHIHRETFFDLLFDKLIDHRVRLTGAGSAELSEKSAEKR
jgi:hypothetical protein